MSESSEFLSLSPTFSSMNSVFSSRQSKFSELEEYALRYENLQSKRSFMNRRVSTNESKTKHEKELNDSFDFERRKNFENAKRYFEGKGSEFRTLPRKSKKNTEKDNIYPFTTLRRSSAKQKSSFSSSNIINVNHHHNEKLSNFQKFQHRLSVPFLEITDEQVKTPLRTFPGEDWSSVSSSVPPKLPPKTITHSGSPITVERKRTYISKDYHESHKRETLGQQGRYRRTSSPSQPISKHQEYRIHNNNQTSSSSSSSQSDTDDTRCSAPRLFNDIPWKSVPGHSQDYRSSSSRSSSELSSSKNHNSSHSYSSENLSHLSKVGGHILLTTNEIKSNQESSSSPNVICSDQKNTERSKNSQVLYSSSFTTHHFEAYSSENENWKDWKFGSEESLDSGLSSSSPPKLESDSILSSLSGKNESLVSIFSSSSLKSLINEVKGNESNNGNSCCSTTFLSPSHVTCLLSSQMSRMLKDELAEYDLESPEHQRQSKPNNQYHSFLQNNLQGRRDNERKGSCREEEEEDEKLRNKRQKTFLLKNHYNEKLNGYFIQKLQVQKEIYLNESLGDSFSSLVSSLSPNSSQFDKYSLHVQESHKITNLLLSLSSRLAKSEALFDALDPSDDFLNQKTSLLLKRNKLREQMEEALRLKVAIDKRSNVVFSYLSTFLESSVLSEIQSFLSRQTELLTQNRAIEDQIQGIQEQLAILLLLS